jgi:hypothetical protein
MLLEGFRKAKQNPLFNLHTTVDYFHDGKVLNREQARRPARIRQHISQSFRVKSKECKMPQGNLCFHFIFMYSGGSFINGPSLLSKRDKKKAE